MAEGRYTFPCSRDFFPAQCALADIKALFARKPWPQLQRVDVRGVWECPRCVKWSAGLGAQDVSDEALSGSKCSWRWEYPT